MTNDEGSTGDDLVEAITKGALTGHSVTGVRFVLQEGLAHLVDSSELAFKLATIGAFREAFSKAQPTVMEPRMTVEVVAPTQVFATGIASTARVAMIVMLPSTTICALY